ncbi:MAG TPA: hypothetical protein PKC18_06240 [Lacipirellulaceae bacterium]|nr:hypothetical protein [Lacipirellulaceae bacterium]
MASSAASQMLWAVARNPSADDGVADASSSACSTRSRPEASSFSNCISPACCCSSSACCCSSSDCCCSSSLCCSSSSDCVCSSSFCAAISSSRATSSALAASRFSLDCSSDSMLSYSRRWATISRSTTTPMVRILTAIIAIAAGGDTAWCSSATNMNTWMPAITQKAIVLAA